MSTERGVLQWRRAFWWLLLAWPFGISAMSSIDLSQKDFWRQGPYALDGYWDFYPSNFIDPDSSQSIEDNFRVRLNTLWNDIEGFGTRWTAFGYATYWVKVFVPANRPELGLKIPDMYTAYRLYANGELVSQNGVRGDGMKLKQALSHLGGLLVRAVNHGELAVEARAVGDSSQNLVLEVVFHFEPGYIDDRLVGLYKDTRGRLNSTRILRYDTQAMGLHMASQIVRALGGEIIALGSPAHTMGFKFSFEKVTLTKAEEEKPINTKLRILVVEDNPVNRKLIEMMFNSLGLSSAMAENGQIALDMVKEGNFHMVFMDLQMPVMDGIESTKRIMAEVNHRPVIVALTANSTQDDRNMALDAGMNDFMTKPLKINELREMILKWQSVSQVLDEL